MKYECKIIKTFDLIDILIHLSVTFLSILVSMYLCCSRHVLEYPGDAVEGCVAEVAVGGAHVATLDALLVTSLMARLRGGRP